MAAEQPVEIVVWFDGDVAGMRSTLSSIRGQDYPLDAIRVFVMIFGDAADTNEWDLLCEGISLGIYRLSGTFAACTAYPAAAGILEHAGRRSCPPLLFLEAGDRLYPSCVTVATRALVDFASEGVRRVILEADILESTGSVRRQAPIYDEARMIIPADAPRVFLAGETDHLVLALGERPQRAYVRSNVAAGWRDWLSQIFFATDQAVAYVPTAVAAIKVREPDDPIEGLLVRWEATASALRAAELEPREAECLERQAMRKLAMWAHGRCNRMTAHALPEQVERCRRLAHIIDPKFSDA